MGDIVGSPWVFSTALIIASLFSLVIAFYSWKRRSLPAAASLAGISLAASVYCIGYAMELASSALPDMLFWSRFEYLGIAVLPAFWVIFVAQYTNKKRFLTEPVRMALFSLSGLTLILHWTQAFHHFYYVAPRVDASGPFPLLAFNKGPWYWVHQVFINIAFLLAFLLLAASLRGSSPVQRRRTGIMILGSVFPWLFYLVYLSGLGPQDIDLVPFGLALAGPVFAWGVFRLKLLDLVPIARESIFDGMRDGVIVVDVLGRVIDLNPAAGRIFPPLARNTIGQDLAAILPGQPEILGLLRFGAPPEVEILVESEAGRRYYQVRRSPVMNGRRLVGHSIMLSDMTSHNLLQEKLRQQATVDDLTGAFNRRYFLEVGRRELARAKRYSRALSVVIFDLDNFKKINDTFGHEAGDRVLAKTVETVRKELRVSDILGRHGGEEFALILPETPPKHACAVADRVRQALNRIELQVDSGGSLGFTASFGVSGTENVGENPLEDFIRGADRAMYEAKAAGRNCVRCVVCPKS